MTGNEIPCRFLAFVLFSLSTLLSSVSLFLPSAVSHLNYVSQNFSFLSARQQLNYDIFKKYPPIRAESSKNIIKNPSYDFPLIANHPDKHRLIEIRTHLKQALDVRTSLVVNSILENILSKVDKEFHKDIPDYRIVRELDKDFRFHLEKPSWWYDIKFCFSFYAKSSVRNR